MDKKQLTQTVMKAQNGDKEAVKALYLEFVKTVYFLALKATQSSEDAEDITQIVFITVCEKISDLKQPEAFAGWLKRITANKCTDYFRKQGRIFSDDALDIDSIELLQEDDPLLIPENSLDNAETARMITDVIDSLPDPQRLCVYYYYYEQLTIAQIAKLLNTNENAVKKRLQMARGKIRRELEQLYQTEGVKLYSAAPLILTPILELALQSFEMPAQLSSSLWAGIAAESTSAAGIAVTAGLKAKAAMLISGAVITGGIIAGIIMMDNPKGTIPAVGIISGSEVTLSSAAVSVAESEPSETEEITEPAKSQTASTVTKVSSAITSAPASKSEPEVPVISIKIGDIIKLGGYDWRVLDIKDNKAFIISVQVLSLSQYHSNRKEDITWETSDIREWLNDFFYNDSFSAEEKKLITQTKIENKDNQWYGTAGGNATTDKIFLLSAEEVVKHFGDSGQLSSRPGGARYINDEYNPARAALNAGDGKARWWWLRSPGNGGNRTACINNDGDIDLRGDIFDNKNGGIRPAMWILCE